jgi:hypothetical protein
VKVFSVLQRELRVSSRLASTYWLRFGAGLATAVLVCGFLLVAQLWARFGLPVQAGNVLFEMLRVLGFIAALSGGLFLATDALAEERREGTLPLLLLAGLRGFDVALAKVVAALLRSGQWLLAALPLAGISLLMGGVTRMELFTMALALISALFWSVAVALLASSLCRYWSHALLLTLLFLSTGVFGPPLIQAVARWRVAVVSPLNAVSECRAWQYGEFWQSLAWVHAASWICIALAGWRAGHFHSMAPRRGVVLPPRIPERPFPQVHGTSQVHSRISEADPIRWLAARDPWFTWVLNALAVIVLVVFGVLFSVTPDVATALGVMTGGLFGVLVIIYLAAQGSRFFAEAARSGMLELLTVTPLRRRDLIAGPLAVMRRGLLIPLGVALGLRLIHPLSLALGMSLPATMAPGPPNFADFMQLQIVSSLLNAGVFVIEVIAVAWLALLHGLLYRKPVKAFFLTLVLGWLAPTLLVAALRGLTIPLVLFSSVPGWSMGTLLALITGALYLVILLVSRHYLFHRFTELASGDVAWQNRARGTMA